ncbi:hypothetical protein INT43_008360 [Umbelopsis isabellina]|uniref:O-fucosyltransferase family protein n=1 Tax=Mortierella isabellina TaxID=91625 RepID=A0A8H7PDE9_MORIS|nr:hypothetical protein INT43_008360 [Umbelopsis isabellina]
MTITVASPKYVLFLAIIFFFLFSLATFIWASTIAVYFRPIVKYDHNGEKFLAYLPHSGLSNQRNELENALMLAIYLNRTLIVPPAFLGKLPGWHPGNSMDQDMTRKTEPQSWWYRCNDKYAINDGPCNEKTDYLTVPWEFLHEDMIELDIPMRHIRHVSTKKIQKLLSLDDSEIYQQQDKSMYSWVLCDKPRDQCPPVRVGGGNKYDDQWVIEDLQKIPHTLIQLQGMFGSNRVGVSGQEHLELRTKVQEALTYKNPIIDAVTANIVNEMGGKHSYLAVHVRMGNRQFLGNLQNTIAQEIAFLEHELAKMECKQPSSTNCTSPLKIYLATDARNPRTNADLAPLFERFPDAAILDDFSHLLSPLEQAAEVAQPPQESVARFMLPIIESMVSAHAKAFMGTPGSTYSRYIARLHSVYQSSKYSD